MQTVEDAAVNDDRERKIVAQALHEGLITKEQVEACGALRRQSTDDPPPSILKLLLEHGHLTREQVVELVTGQKPGPEAEEPAAPPADPEAPTDAGQPTDAAEPEPEPAEPLPDVDRCEMVEGLGGGTVAATCVVRDPASEQQYVLKVFYPSISRRPGFAEEAQRSAELAAKIRHPNVVHILGWGRRLDDIYVVAEHVRGASLARLLEARGKLEPHEMLAVAVGCAEALEQGERAGLRHGAISPTNILVAHDGTVKLDDLGVPKPLAVDLSIVEAGEGVRSPFYLSPEHLGIGAMDVRSDLFSLGAVLYHGLTGRQPFGGDTTAEVNVAIRSGDCRPIRELAPDVPRAFAAVVGKLIDPDPARRYQSPRELLDDLGAIQAGKVPAAQRAAIARHQSHKAEEVAAPSAEEPPPRKARWPWAVLAAAALALAALGIWAATRPAHDPEEEAVEQIEDTVDPFKERQAELARLVSAPKPEKGKELEAVENTVKALEEFAKTHKGTAEAKEAEKRLVPLRAEALFQSALAFARQHPSRTKAIAERYRQVASEHTNTEAGFKAEQELAKIEGAELDKAQQQFAKARGRAAKLVEQQRFGTAMRQFDALLANKPGEHIEQLILAERLDIKTKADNAYQKIHEQAREQIEGEYYQKAVSLYRRVADTFEIEPHVSQAKGEIANLEPLLKGASLRRLKAIDAAKYDFFLVRIEPSIALARGWELSQAAKEAEKTRGELRDAKIEHYLDAYLADLAVLRTLKFRVIRRLNSRQAGPVVAKQFSLGKFRGHTDRKWLEATVLRADQGHVALRYGEVEVRRTWAQFPTDELYKLGRLATDPKDPKARLALGIHCLYANLLRPARAELNAAKATGLDVASYLQRVELAQGRAKATPSAATTKDEEASLLLLEARRMMAERAWDRALYRLALLRSRHAKGDYDVSLSLKDIDRRIVECKGHVDRLEMETDLALGREVPLIRRDDLADWHQRFGKWSVTKRVIRGEVPEDHDAECLRSLRHPPSYELRGKVRVLSGAGAILRLAGKGRPNVGFWVHAARPGLVGLLHAYPGDEKPAERVRRTFAFKPGQWYAFRAVVSPSFVEVAVGNRYSVRMPNKLPPQTGGVHTYGLVVNTKSAAELRDLTVRVLQEQ